MEGEVNKRGKMLTNTELNDVNLVRVINTKVIPVAAYPMNVCKFNGGDLKGLNQVIKRELRSKNMLRKQSSDERLYLRREDGERGIKLLKDIYKETKMTVACYMAYSESKWISAAWRKENTKEANSIVEEAMKTMDDVGVEIQFEEGNSDRWRADRWRMKTSVEEIEGEVEKGSEEYRGRVEERRGG